MRPAFPRSPSRTRAAVEPRRQRSPELRRSCSPSAPPRRSGCGAATSRGRILRRSQWGRTLKGVVGTQGGAVPRYLKPFTIGLAVAMTVLGGALALSVVHDPSGDDARAAN